MVARKTWLDIASDVSKRFGQEWRKAIDGQKVDTEELHAALKRVVEKQGLFEKPESSWSVSERQIYDYYQKVGKQVPGTAQSTEVVMTAEGPQRAVVATGSETLDLAKVDRDLQAIFRPKAGTKYTSAEHILTVTREEIANTLGDMSDKIKAVRMKFAPELQMKNEAYNIFQPFNRSGAYDTTKGINFFAKFAKGQSNPDEIRLINALKSKTDPNFLGELNSAAAKRGDLFKKTQILANQQPEKVNAVKQKYLKSFVENANDEMNHKSLLDAMRQVAMTDEAKEAFMKKIIASGIKGAAASAGAGSVAAAGYGLYKAFTD